MAFVVADNGLSSPLAEATGIPGFGTSNHTLNRAKRCFCWQASEERSWDLPFSLVRVLHRCSHSNPH